MNKILRTLKPLTSLLIKPAGADCNIDCGYCFYLDRAGTPRPGYKDLLGPNRIHGRKMSPEVQEIMIRQAMQQGERQISFGWQGGEPTLCGLDFFERAVSLQRQYGSHGQVVGNALQTNGLLIDEKWCDFLCKTNWLIGLSIDGPPEIHDHYRLTRNGKPTYELVRQAAELMTAKKVQFNALTVVSDHSAQYAREIYEHHKSLGIEFMQFIPCVETDPHHPNKAASFSVSAEAYGQFLCDIYDLWKADFKNGRPTISVRYFDSVFHTYVSVPPPECTLLRECGNYLVVEYNGDVFSCDFFVENEWCLGNVTEKTLLEMLNSQKQKKFAELKAHLPDECHSCQWLSHCRGGCTKDRIRDPAEHGSNHFCKSYIRFFEHADRDLRKIADNWKREQEAHAHREMMRAMKSRMQPSQTPSNTRRPVSANAPCPCGSGKKYKRCCGTTR